MCWPLVLNFGIPSRTAPPHHSNSNTHNKSSTPYLLVGLLDMRALVPPFFCAVRLMPLAWLSHTYNVIMRQDSSIMLRNKRNIALLEQ